MHGHHHHHEPASYNRAFAIGIALNAAYILLEAGAGFAVNSLALLADAGHNLSDVLGLLLAWAAHVAVRAKSTAYRTYGWRGTSILAALANALILLLVTGGIAWEAIQRFQSPSPISGWVVVAVAAIGVLVNTATAMLFYSGCQHDLNIRGAFLHMAADAGVSLAVVISGVLFMSYGWLWIDPITSLIVVAMIFISTWGLLRDSLDLALHAVPKKIQLAEVHAFLVNLPGVELAHDLHVWGLSTTETALTVHLVMPRVENNDEFLALVTHELHDRFNIEHATIQIERDVESAWCQHQDCGGAVTTSNAEAVASANEG